jgi:hypothetical protein
MDSQARDTDQQTDKVLARRLDRDGHWVAAFDIIFHTDWHMYTTQLFSGRPAFVA